MSASELGKVAEETEQKIEWEVTHDNHCGELPRKVQAIILSALKEVTAKEEQFEKMRNLLELLNNRGGLGLNIHREIHEVLSFPVQKSVTDGSSQPAVPNIDTQRMEQHYERMHKRDGSLPWVVSDIFDDGKSRCVVNNHNELIFALGWHLSYAQCQEIVGRHNDGEPSLQSTPSNSPEAGGASAEGETVAVGPCPREEEGELVKLAQLSTYFWSQITRLEVIDETGRAYSKWSIAIDPSLQDEGRTLKVFVKRRVPSPQPVVNDSPKDKTIPDEGESLLWTCWPRGDDLVHVYQKNEIQTIITPEPVSSAQGNMICKYHNETLLPAVCDTQRLDWLEKELRRPRIDGIAPFMYWLGERYMRGPFRDAIDKAMGVKTHTGATKQAECEPPRQLPKSAVEPCPREEEGRSVEPELSGDTILINACDYVRAFGTAIPRVPSSNPKYIKHVLCEGARFHVISYSGMSDGTSRMRCSEPDCIINKPPQPVINDSPKDKTIPAGGEETADLSQLATMQELLCELDLHRPETFLTWGKKREAFLTAYRAEMKNRIPLSTTGEAGEKKEDL